MRPKSILIVDDDYEDIELFKEVLGEIDSGIECITASDGIEALEVLGGLKTYPDYIFLDMNMPRLNGKQCLAKLKENQSLNHICVIIYTTSKLDSDMKETKALGASYFLTKPTRFEDIKAVVSHILTDIKVKPSNNLKKFLLEL